MMRFNSSTIYPVLMLAGLVLISVESIGCASEGSAAESRMEEAQPDLTVARDISDVELMALLNDRPDLLLVDVRTDREWQKGHIGGACFLDFLEDDFRERAASLPKDRPIAVYCAAGGRSADAMAFLSNAGFKEVYNLRGGFYGWEDAGREVSNGPPVPLPE